MEMLSLNVVCVVSLLLGKICLAEDATNCEFKETCGECIREYGCVWCTQPIANEDPKSEKHCIPQNITPLPCNSSYLISPQLSYEILQELPLSSEKNNQIQITPQRVKLTLRRGEKFKLTFQYKQAENYPVDLYYLMDLSASMEPHRKKLGTLGRQLAEAMRNITTNFKLGFGSFVDKVDLPFVSTVPEKLKAPCNFNGVDCLPPYSFKNQLALTDSYEQFTYEVTNAKVSGNLDSPEGGFDALMQAMVCKDEIRWTSQARRLLVFSTDASSHIAGDGKLAGVVEPNDGQCHTENGSYVAYLKYDYPSVSQINYVAKQNNINIVFAIVDKGENLNRLYEKLSQRIENSNIGILADDSKNVINLVTENYNKIVDSVTITSNATSDVNVKISSNCASPKENGCTNVHVGEVVTFTATIEALECPPEGTTKKYIKIKPQALDDSLVVELDVVCDCDCANYEANSDRCSNEGNLECGVCRCRSGRYGRNCQCDSETSDSEDSTNCKTNEKGEICNSLGICKCGKCECNRRTNPSEMIWGKFCECNNYSCKREKGELCSGNGKCECAGKCQCFSGWMGEACQCPDNDAACIAPGDDKVCSGHGNCKCGQCECHLYSSKDNDKYSGTYCERSPSQQCAALQPCVECLAFGSGAFDNVTCTTNCSGFTLTKTKILDKTVDREEEEVKSKICTVLDESECKIFFKFYEENNKFVVTVKEEKECPDLPDVSAWVLGVIGSILAAGLIMLSVWKVFTTIHDRREYEKFENERKAAKWGTTENPLYRGATTTFQNPFFNRSSRISTKSTE